MNLTEQIAALETKAHVVDEIRKLLGGGEDRARFVEVLDERDATRTQLNAAKARIASLEEQNENLVKARDADHADAVTARREAAKEHAQWKDMLDRVETLGHQDGAARSSLRSAAQRLGERFDGDPESPEMSVDVLASKIDEAVAGLLEDYECAKAERPSTKAKKPKPDFVAADVPGCIWKTIRPATDGKMCGAAWELFCAKVDGQWAAVGDDMQPTGFVVEHCGHPTANNPFTVVTPHDVELPAAAARAFTSVKDARKILERAFERRCEMDQLLTSFTAGASAPPAEPTPAASSTIDSSSPPAAKASEVVATDDPFVLMRTIPSGRQLWSDRDGRYVPLTEQDLATRRHDALDLEAIKRAKNLRKSKVCRLSEALAPRAPKDNPPRVPKANPPRVVVLAESGDEGAFVVCTNTDDKRAWLTTSQGLHTEFPSGFTETQHAADEQGNPIAEFELLDEARAAAADLAKAMPNAGTITIVEVHDVGRVVSADEKRGAAE